MLRKEAGKICGKNVATTLSRYAAPVPRPISVNILGLRLTSEDQKHSKKGQPPQRTTGVARRNSMPFRTVDVRCKPSDSPSMESSKTGSDKAALTQKRRRIESYSGSASTPAKMSKGSSAMPQMGQLPGPNRMISGCIGQVYRFFSPSDAASDAVVPECSIAPCPGGAEPWSISAAPGAARNFSGSREKRSAQPFEQK